MNIGIVGSRRRDSLADYEKTLAAYYKVCEDIAALERIVSGGCPKGGDRFAERIAATFFITPLIHYPDKGQLDQELFKNNPRAAFAKINYVRNALIARDSDILIAVVAPDRKGGTENTIKHFCEKLGKTEKELITEGKLILV